MNAKLMALEYAELAELLLYYFFQLFIFAKLSEIYFTRNFK